MYQLLVVIFWISVFIVFYTYLGYGLVAWLLVKVRKSLKIGYPVPEDSDFSPAVTVVIPAYNELDYIDEKLQNTLALNYPAYLLHIFFVTEGSNDGTTEFVENQARSNPRIKFLGGQQRRGKVPAINAVMPHITTPITIFTDANTALNPLSIKMIVRHFSDPQVGAVSGEKRIKTLQTDTAAGAGEGLYWKYESFLKKLDTQLYSVVGAAGELFAVRTELYEEVEKDTLLDDFMISLRIAQKGYRVIYEPEAYAMERPSHSMQDEQKRKVRIAAGGFQAIHRLRKLNNIFRYGMLSFQYISHRVLRWAVTPFLLPFILFLNLLLTVAGSSSSRRFYLFLLMGQVLFYAGAYVGYYFENRNRRVKWLYVPYYFTFMNWCALLGYDRYRKGIVTGAWEKSRRAV
jgi:cellulose synthase/poly-beta-1,6-N-acetylglucosamine synthase-like glycosyltransferase